MLLIKKSSMSRGTYTVKTFVAYLSMLSFDANIATPINPFFSIMGEPLVSFNFIVSMKFSAIDR